MLKSGLMSRIAEPFVETLMVGGISNVTFVDRGRLINGRIDVKDSTEASASAERLFLLAERTHPPIVPMVVRSVTTTSIGTSCAWG